MATAVTESYDELVPSLNEAQKALLMALEEEFKNRYTEDDENFKAALERKLPPPPIYDNWFKYYDNRHWRNDNHRGGYRDSHRQRPNDYESYRGYRRDDDDDYESGRRDRPGHHYFHRRREPRAYPRY